MGKSVSVSYRVSPRFKQLLELAAAREHRSQTNMLESILFDYCKAHQIEGVQSVPVAPKQRRDPKQ